MNGSTPSVSGRMFLALLAALALGSCGRSEIPTSREAAQAKWAAVEQAYRARAMLVPDLTPAMQGASDEEQEMLNEVMDARKHAIEAKIELDDLDEPVALDGYVQAQSQLIAQVDHLVGSEEQFPNLDTAVSVGFLDQQVKQANASIHGAIAAYNAAATKYNKRITSFPDFIVAKVLYAAEPMVLLEDSQTDPQ